MKDSSGDLTATLDTLRQTSKDFSVPSSSRIWTGEDLSTRSNPAKIVLSFIMAGTSLSSHILSAF